MGSPCSPRFSSAPVSCCSRTRPSAEPDSRFLSLRLILDLFHKPRWLLGIGCMVAGQVLAAWSIGNLPLAFVEPLLTTNLVFALLVAVPIAKARLRFWEIAGALVLCTGVALLSVSRSAKPIGLSFGSFSHWPAAAAIAFIAFVCVQVGRRRPGRARAMLTGAAAGLIFGIQDALTRQTLPWQALLSARRPGELLTGHNRDEYRLFLAMGGKLGNVTEEEAATTLATFAPAPDGAAAYRKAFPDADPSAMYELIFSDWLFRMPTLHLAQAHAASGGRTYLYELAAEAPAGPFGACHGLDVPLVFGAMGSGLSAMLTGPTPPAAFVALGDTMRREWLAFAATGEPGWPAYGTEHRATRVYDLQPDVVSYPEETSMHLWERHQFDALGLTA